ncbi:hypothetical protein ACHAXR_010595, partial [Thalassiosira sp. AJA248-18]
AYRTKKARVDGPSTPEKKAKLLSSLDDIIPLDKAAESTLNSVAGTEKSDDVRPEKIEAHDDDSDDEKDEKEWLVKVAASLGANTSRLRQQQSDGGFRPMYRPLTGSSSDGPLHTSKPSANSTPIAHSNAMKSDTASTCSTISTSSDNKLSSGKHESISLKQPPDELVLVSRSSPALSANDVPSSSLSEFSIGSRHGCLVHHKHDSRRRVGEVILEHDSTSVEVAMNGVLKKYQVSHLLVVPPHQFKVGDTVPPNYSVPNSGSSKSPMKEITNNKLRSKSSSSEQKLSALSADRLFCWFCDNCNADNKMLDLVCHSCDMTKTAESKRSVLLEIAETSIKGDVVTVGDAMSRITCKDRPSIPEQVIAHMLGVKTLGAAAQLSPEPSFDVDMATLKLTWEGLYYWMCGSCTMQNSYKRSTCSACLQGLGLAERSPLLRIAEDAASNSKTTNEALSRVPESERLLIPTVVMDTLVTCVFVIEGRNGQRRRCRKQKMEGYDFCVAHCDPKLLSNPRADTQGSSIGTISSNGVDSLSQASIGGKRCRGIAAINEIMPSFLKNIQQAQVNENRWAIYSIEDSVLCGNSAFPLGMKVRKFFDGYGFHDGSIQKCARKLHVDSNKSEERPVLVYRLKYNDGDQEDFLHHEIASLRESKLHESTFLCLVNCIQLAYFPPELASTSLFPFTASLPPVYDGCNVSPEAPPEVQIQPGSLFETRFGTMKIIELKESARDGKVQVTVKFCDSSKNVEFDLLKLQMTVLRKINSSESSNTALVHKLDSSPTKSLASTSARAPVLEWPGRGLNQTDDESIEAEDEYYDICEGLSLHRKRCNDSLDVAKLPTTSSVNNPCDIRPGCNVSMWDPAACYGRLSWDPYASTLCELCGIDKDDNQLVICDECHSGFHTYCLRPVMVNIPKGDWLCSACSGRSSARISFDEYSENICHQHEDIFNYLGLSYKTPAEFFSIHSEAIQLFSLDSQHAVKQRAISQQVLAKKVVFDVGDVKFVRSPVKHDWRLPTPLLSEEEYASSILSMVSAMKFCGMEKYIVDQVYSGTITEEMNDPSLEVDEITPMSKRNLDIFRAYRHNARRGVLPAVQIIHDENFGFSVKTLASMPRHTIIGEYLGEIVTMEQSGQSNSDSLMVLLDTGDHTTSLILDPTRAGNITRFISGINNRSLMSKRKANVRTRRFFIDGVVRVCLFTSRRVEAGEILNYDYNAGNEGKAVDQWAKSGFYDTSNFF